MSLGLGNLKKIPISIFHHQIDLMKVLFILGYLCLGSWAQGTSSTRSRISVTLTAAGALGTFNPPSDCSKFSAYSTQTLEFVAVRRSTEGFWITYPAIGTTTGKLCCPRAASSIKYKADGPVPLCLATSKGPTITEEKSVINHESVYFGSAVIVIPPGATDPPLSTIGGGEGTESPTPRQASPPTIEHSSFEPPSQSGTMAAPSTSSGLQPQEQGSQESQPSGLSGGAIAGIAVGVSVPLILVGLYLAYRFGRRMNRPPKQHKGQGVEVTAQEYPDNGREGGVLFSPEIGGIRSNGE
ncbi:hypothetical protein TWF173_010009 [Orbilia oligospora]|nr:hypothetical protein TWF173_010009 [Orbilia oligospora]